jgi:hypothetical protein
MRLLKKFTPFLALAMAVGIMMPSSAYANGGPVAGTAVVTGSGTITPGLTTTATPQSVSFDGTAVASVVIGSPNDTHEVTGVLNCSFRGVDPAGTVLVGAGSGMAMCSGTGGVHATVPVVGVPAVGTNATATVTCDALAFTRVLVVVVATATGCTVDVSSSAGHTFGVARVTVECVFEPDQVTPPVTSYRLQCAAELDPV